MKLPVTESSPAHASASFDELTDNQDGDRNINPSSDHDSDLHSAAELAEHCPVALSLHSEAGQFLSASPACEQVFGRALPALRLQSLIQLVAASERESLQHAWIRAGLGDATRVIRYRLSPDAPAAGSGAAAASAEAGPPEAIWIETEVRRVAAPVGADGRPSRPLRLACASRRVVVASESEDVARAAASTTPGESDCELALRHRDQMVAMLPAMVWYGPIGADGKSYKLSYMSEYLFRLSGYTPSQWFETPGFWAERLHPDDREATLAATRRMLQDGSELAPYRFRIDDGSYLWLQSTIRIERDTDGKPVRMYGITMDVTRYKQAEHEAARLHRELAEKVAHILELSAPVLPTGDGSLVLPLIGSLDPARTEHALTQLLSRVVALRARRVIVDLTGVAQADEQSAAALMRAAQAIRLLGAQPILCGIRAEMALALGRHHEDLSRITTVATLHEALRAAVRGTGAAGPLTAAILPQRPSPRQQT